MKQLCANCSDEIIEVCSCLKQGDLAPDFEADTTHGPIKFSEYREGKWTILFSHPADFTPVCTTEFVEFAQRIDEFNKRNVKLIGLSVDSVYSHIAWVRQIEEKLNVKIPFPIIADIPMTVSDAYDMIHPAISEIHPVRTLVFIDPEGIVRMSISYPASVGRNIDEVIRIIDALQMVDKEKVATPVNWKPGDNVIVPPPKTVNEAEKACHQQHEECVDWFLCKRKA